ncbi:TlpA disulfide reductase family protein [Gemmatimonas sp.]|jgi:peroxiredoxin|uniref:peroxiredoxin family protein n=1 Tax=Gemmatimonas sp. TaxID=1962908 RepID=UPI0022C0B05C|nr:TlpA disulfide reductase family protein [Gemmatimonas sp.]MCZ8204149.1 TlpA disulfide reductase family protein [Gemmatimonas sp.]
MTAKQQWLVVLGIVALLGGGAFAASHFLEDELTSITMGSDAPGFAAATLDTPPRMKSLSDYRGEVVVLNIWATWCIPCRTEMPSMEKLFKELGPKGLKMVAVSVDNAGEEEKIREFVKEYGLTFEVLHDAAGSIQGIYRTTGVPETFVLDRDGVIRKKWIGADDWASDGNRRLLEQLLAQPKS